MCLCAHKINSMSCSTINLYDVKDSLIIIFIAENFHFTTDLSIVNVWKCTEGPVFGALSGTEPLVLVEKFCRRVAQSRT